MARPARLSLVTLVVLSLTGVTACGSVDAGTEAAEEFRQWMADTEHVASLDLNSNNALPWSGSLEGGVVVEPDATVAQIADVAQRATSFESRASLTFTIGYTRGDFVARFAVFPDSEAANLAMIELADDVDRSTAATELTAAQAAGNDAAQVTVTGPDSFLATFDQVATMIASKDLHAWATGDLLTVQDAAGTFSIAADRRTGAARPRAAYEAVNARFPVTAAQLTDTTLDVRVDAVETPAVLALARLAAPDVTTTAHFGTVTKAGTGDYAAADALLAQVTAAGPVLSSSLSTRSVRVVVPDVATLLAIYAAVGDGPQYGGVDLTVSTADGAFMVASTGRPVTTYLPVLNELSAPHWEPLLQSVEIAANGLDLRTADLTPSQAQDVGAAASLTPVGAQIEVRPGWGVGFRFNSVAPLTIENLDTFGTPSEPEAAVVAGFVSGWNS